MYNSLPKLDPPRNEPVRPYRPGDEQTASLRKRLATMREETIEVPLIVGGEEIRT